MTAMHCHKCERQAVIHMREHRLILCQDHFIEWIGEQTGRFIKEYSMFSRQERILVAVSGGKDSLSLWDVLWRLGYTADGMYIHLGIGGPGGYSDESKRFASEFAAQRGLKLIVKNVAQSYRLSVPQLALRTGWGQDRPCGVCGIIKRHLMNEAALEGSYPVLATAHNLDDEVAFLMQNTLNWQTNFLRRQSPVLEGGPGFARKVKPFCRFYERETAAYAISGGIPYIEEECPHAGGSKQTEFKELLNKMEVEHPGTKLNFFTGFMKARQEGLFPPIPGELEDGGRNLCPQCGQPTTSSGLCSFCKIVK